MRNRYLKFDIDSQDQPLDPGEMIEYVCTGPGVAEAVYDATVAQQIATLAWRFDFPGGESLGLVIGARLRGDSISVTIFNASDAQKTLNAGVLTAVVILVAEPEKASNGTSDNGTIFGPFIVLP